MHHVLANPICSILGGCDIGVRIELRNRFLDSSFNLAVRPCDIAHKRLAPVPSTFFVIQSAASWAVFPS